MKTSIRFLFVVAILLSMAIDAQPCSASNGIYNYDFTVDGIFYKYVSSDGSEATDTTTTVEVTYQIDYNPYIARPYSGDVVIPQNVTYNSKTFSVIGIGKSAFYLCTDVSSIALPSSITYIGENAFSKCTGLTSVDIPESVTSIGDGAFYNCTGVTFINLPESLVSIGGSAFSGLKNISSLSLPSSLKTIGAYAFDGLQNISTLWIPDSVDSIGDGAFNKCDSLKGVYIGRSVTYLGANAFDNCNALILAYCAAPTPPKNPFHSTAQEPYTIFDNKIDMVYVPKGTLDSYKNCNEFWKNIKYLGEFDFDKETLTFVTAPIDSIVTVSVSQPGSLYDDLKQVCPATRMVTKLKVDGEINSTDVRKLRMMAKGENWTKSSSYDHDFARLYYFDNSKIYNLNYLDLSDASIAASNKANDQPYHTIAKGNTEYNPTIVSLYTEKDKLTDYIFGRVKGLKTLITPKSVTSMTAKSIDNRLTECTINSKVLPKGLFKREKDDDLTATNSMEKMEFSNNLEVIGDSVAVNYDKMQGLDKMVRMPDNVWYIGDCSFPKTDFYFSPTALSKIRYIGKGSTNKIFFDASDTVNLDSVVAINHFVSSAENGCGTPSTLNVTFTHAISSDQDVYTQKLSKIEFGLDSISIPSLKTVNLKIDGTDTDGDEIKIGSGCFNGCQSLECINMQEGQYMNIDKYAFKGLHSLKQVNGVSNVSDYSFADCTSLESVTFKPHGIVKALNLDKWGLAFKGCHNLKNLNCTDLDLSIDGLASKDGALYYVSGGKARLVLYPGSDTEYLEWTSDFDNAYPHAFVNNENVTSINIVSGYLPKAVTRIFPNLKTVTVEPTSNYVMVDGNLYEKGDEEGETRKLVLHMTGLPDTLVLPSDFNTSIYIGTYPNLRKITIPKDMTKVNGLFPNAERLDTIIFKATQPPQVESEWTDITLRSMRERREQTSLFLPYGCVDKYINDDFWSWFKDYFHAPKYMSVNALKTEDVAIKAEGLTIDVEGLDDGKQLQVYGIDGRLVYAGAGRRITLPGAGLYIVKAGTKIQKITVQ